MSKSYAQLAREIAALQVSAQRQLAVESKGAVAKINEMIAKYKLSPGDLKFAAAGAAAAPQARVSGAAKAKGSAASQQKRFSDGQGNVWGGRGPRPRWLRSAIAAGQALESFLTGGSPVATPATALPKAPVAKSAAAKKTAGPSVAGKRASVAPQASIATGAAKAAAKRAVVKKSPSGKLAVKTSSAAASATSPVSAPKVVSKKTAAKKAPVKKTSATKTPASPPARKVAAKKSPTAKAAAVKTRLAPAATKTTAAKQPAAPALESPAAAAT